MEISLANGPPLSHCSLLFRSSYHPLLFCTISIFLHYCKSSPVIPFDGICPCLIEADKKMDASKASIIALVTVMVTIVSLWVGLRVWARRIRKLSIFLTEDILCYIALIFYYGICADGAILVVVGGAGQHITQLQPLQVEQFSQAVFAYQVLYAFCLGFTKLSIARNLQRIFFTRQFRKATFLVMGVTVVWMLQTILIGLLICQPIQLNWDPTARGTCGN
ncbi:hypothetical protein F5Y03DRAFT_379156 [Xylaria venustula]|nr:hypothetical protein F5Y03DRAFT_379156 [Xylaria venustula]